MIKIEFPPLTATYSIYQRPSWHANRPSASKETPAFCGNLQVHYRIHKCPPPAPS